MNSLRKRAAAIAVSASMCVATLPLMAGSALAQTGDCPEAAAGYSGGDGSIGDPYIIASPGEFQRLQTVSGDWDKNFQLTSSISMTGDPGLGICEWDSTIGDFDTPFTGSFVGGGFTISDLNVAIQGAEGFDAAAGIFGILGAAGSLSNIQLVDISVSAAGDKTVYAGALVGVANGTVSGGVDVTTSTAEASSTAVEDDGQSANAGGLAGWLTSTGSMTNTSFTGTVTATTADLSYAGGIVGQNSGSISDANSDAVVTASSGLGSVYAGGIAGFNEGSVEFGYADGQVDAVTIPDPLGVDTLRNAYAGGVAGLSLGSGNLSDVVSFGTVEADGQNAFAGGIAGFADDPIVDAYTTGQVSALTDSALTQKAYAGGIVGRLSSSGGLTRTFSNASVLANANGGDSDAYAGGLGGFVDSGVNISSSGAYNAVTGNGTYSASVGGAVGYNSAIVADSYAAATISGAAGVDNYFGGFFGNNSGGDATASFWDSELADPLPAVGNGDAPSDLTAATTAQMTTLQTYLDAFWSIDAAYEPAAIWNMCAAVNGGYPLFASLFSAGSCTGIFPQTQSINGYVDVAVAETSVFTAEYFTGAVTYTVSPELPDGLTLDENSGVISGTPTAALAATVYTITGTDGVDSAEAQITITVLEASLSPEEQTVSGVVDVAITETSALVATNFAGEVSYTINPVLPDGLSIDPDTGVISGIPTSEYGPTVHTITGTSGTQTATTEVLVTVVDVSLSPETQSIIGQAGTAITESAAFVTTNFAGTVTYTVAPALPDGLSMDPDTGVVSGTPVAASGPTDYTVTGTDGVDSAEATISITIVEVSLAPTTQTMTGLVDVAVTASDPIVASGFPDPVTFTVSPELPDGLTMDADTGVISGTPTAASGPTPFTIVGTDGSFSAESVITITVSAAALSPTEQTMLGVVDVAVTASEALVASDFAGAVTYTVAPALPNGLSLDADTGIVSGTPTETSGPTVYTITGTSGAQTADATIEITVVGAALSPADQVLGGIVGVPVVASATLTATGFADPVTYTVAPELPAGLSLDPDTGAISGTPTAISGAAVYTITGSDGTETATATVAITVTEASLSPATQNLSGVAGTPVTPSSAFVPSDFAGAVTYSITPSLPSGLVLDAATGVISGTPVAASGPAVYTVTGTSGAQTASATITITVTSPAPPPSDPPTAPLNVTGVAGDGKVTLSWAAPASQGSFPVTHYQATSTPGGKVCLVAAPALTCEMTGLTNGTAYTFTVKALNGAGWSPASAPSSSITPTAPPKPTITVSAERKGRTVIVSGITTELAGKRVTPMIRFPGQSYSEGKSRTIAEDGTFQWTRKTNKKVYVYFVVEEVRSERLIIPAR